MQLKLYFKKGQKSIISKSISRNQKNNRKTMNHLDIYFKKLEKQINSKEEVNNNNKNGNE